MTTPNDMTPAPSVVRATNNPILEGLFKPKPSGEPQDHGAPPPVDQSRLEALSSEVAGMRESLKGVESSLMDIHSTIKDMISGAAAQPPAPPETPTETPSVSTPTNTTGTEAPLGDSATETPST
jgi:hypothetical protein